VYSKEIALYFQNFLRFCVFNDTSLGNHMVEMLFSRESNLITPNLKSNWRDRRQPVKCKRQQSFTMWCFSKQTSVFIFHQQPDANGRGRQKVTYTRGFELPRDSASHFPQPRAAKTTGDAPALKSLCPTSPSAGPGGAEQGTQRTNGVHKSTDLCAS